MALSEEDAAALRADLERLQQEKGAAETANREYETKSERLRKERLMGTSFDRQGDGGSADCGGTAATTTHGSHVDAWSECRRWFGATFVVCSPGCCTKRPLGMPSLRLHRLGTTF